MLSPKAWPARIRELRREVRVLASACTHPRTPWYAKILAGCVVAYALSPIDRIPDPIPILGYLDDLVLVPLGIVLVRWLVPSSVLAECREIDSVSTASVRGRWIAALFVVVIWLALAAVAFRIAWSTFVAREAGPTPT